MKMTKNKMKRILAKKVIDIAINSDTEASLKAMSFIVSRLDNTYKFRPAMELFSEAMNEMVVFDTPFMLLDYISKYHIDISSLRTKNQGIDNREGWEDYSYIIIARWDDGTISPVGYTNRKIRKVDVNSYLKSKIRGDY